MNVNTLRGLMREAEQVQAGLINRLNNADNQATIITLSQKVQAKGLLIQELQYQINEQEYNGED